MTNTIREEICDGDFMELFNIRDRKKQIIVVGNHDIE